MLTSLSPIAIIKSTIRGKENNDSMLQYKIATSEDIAELMQIRLEMLREVNDLSPDYVFSEEFCLYSAATISLTDSTRRCLPLMEK